jgi:ubiquitin-like protein Pup
MTQQRKFRTDSSASPDTTAKPDVRPSERGRQLGKTIDRLVDEIDAVLEENAAEFVKGYVQRGGE